MAISALLPFASAFDFTLDVPQEVEVNVLFEVSIAADSYDSYDVKIFVHSGDKNAYVSQVNDGGAWRSPRTYMKGVFPEQEVYEVRIVDFVGEAELCVRLRKTGGSSFEELCKEIIVIENADTEGITEESEANAEYTDLEKDDIIVREEPSYGYVDKTRTYIVYAFIVFCAAVIGLAWFEKL